MLKRNLIANYLGQGWTALMGLAFIPLYIKYLGIEAYGLIGLFGVLQAWLGLLDMGMTPTLNREMARFTGGARSATSIRDLLRSIEIIGVIVATLLTACICAASGWLASDWLRAEKLPVMAVAHAFNVMGLVTALRFIEGIYRSAIIGLQRQVLYNVVNSSLVTLRWFGAAAVLFWIAPTIEAFFIWQGIISTITLIVLLFVTYSALPKAERGGVFSKDELRSIGHFAGGMFRITFLALLLTQMDKILLSKLLTLSEYGYYTLASVLAGALYMLTGPVCQAWYPHLSELHATNNKTELITKYHQGAQLVSVLMGSAAIIMIVYSRTILHLWTHDTVLANRSATLLSLLALGNLLNGLNWIPYQTQLAHGWTSLATRVNVVSIITILPAIYWATSIYGTEGAAWIWVLLNTIYLTIGNHFMYRKIMVLEKWRWYLEDLLKPLMAAVACSSFMSWIMPENMNDIYLLTWLIFTSLLTLLSSAFAATRVRDGLMVQFNTTCRRQQ